jgi:hypothetical protein
MQFEAQERILFSQKDLSCRILSVQDIPEWLSLPMGLGFGILITVIVYRLQKRTEKIRDEVLDMIDEVITKIDSYIEGRKKWKQENVTTGL